MLDNCPYNHSHRSYVCLRLILSNTRYYISCMKHRTRKSLYLHIATCSTVIACYLINKSIFSNIIILKCYFNDLLCGFGFYSFIYISYYLVSGKEPPKTIDHFSVILCLIFLASLFWEYVAPLYIKSSTPDCYDVICYMSGCCVFLILRLIAISEYRTIKFIHTGRIPSRSR